jgi:hypothetical protein
MPTEKRWLSRYHRKRQALLDMLDNKCIICGNSDNLEFHHPYGKSWESHSINGITRLNRYRKDMDNGNLELWCKSDHSSITNKGRSHETKIPF